MRSRPSKAARRLARMAISRTRPQPYQHFAARDRRCDLFAELESWQGIARRGLHPSERRVVATHIDNLRAANRYAAKVLP